VKNNWNAKNNAWNKNRHKREHTMKIAIVYTSTTPQLIEYVEREIKTQFSDSAIEFISFQDPSVLSDTIAAGAVPRLAAVRLSRLYLDAVAAGADLVLSACSSVGDVAAAVQPLLSQLGVPLVRIDELMARQVVLAHNRIAVLATLPSTLNPTINLVRLTSAQLNKPVQIEAALAEGAFGLPPDEFRALLLKTCEPLLDKIDAVLMAQGSMAYSEEWLQGKTGKAVYSSPRFGALALKQTAWQLS
jgi:hypothetical protein